MSALRRDGHDLPWSVDRPTGSKRPAARVSVLACCCTLLLAGCADGEVRPQGASSPSIGAGLDNMYDVGGHELFFECQGAGSPTVIYLHGFIRDPGSGSSLNAGRLPDVLEDRYQFCAYDRANVGQSGQVPGPLTGKHSVADLHALLAEADVPTPVLLLGASWGGLLSSMYAATYPEDVAGMVLLDPPLPTDNELEARFLPVDQRLPPGAWDENEEKVDQYVTTEQAHALLAKEQHLPVSFLATQQPELDPTWPVEPMTRAIREYQEQFMTRYPEGDLAIVESPHFMEAAIPERIAEEVDEVAASSR